MSAPRAPGQRAGLTHERVLRGARELVAERGAGGLTMRALAQRLGVVPNTLYSHVSSKTGLVDDLLDAALSEVAPPARAGESPADRMHDLMSSTYRVLLVHADLLPLFLARRGSRGRNAQRLGDQMLDLLADAGLTGTRADEALHVLIVYTIGSAAFAARSPLSTGTEPAADTDRHRSDFSQGLRWLLAGVTSAGPPGDTTKTA